MALDIPMPELSGDSFTKGIAAGSDLIHKMMLNKYYGQLHPSGDVANAMYVEQLRQQFGENDPRYISAKLAHDLTLQGHQSLMDYRTILGQTAPYRATSPLGKEIAEGKGHGALDIIGNRGGGGTRGTGVNSGYSYDANGNNIPATPQEVDNAANGGAPAATGDNNPRTEEERAAYERSINKKTSDAQARNLLLRSENLDKTRHSIDPDDLTRYSGLKGTGKYVYESAQAMRGNPSDEFLAHQQAVNAATLMVDQMRQFYGDSIQPAAMARLTHLANPSTWYKDPKVAKAQWNQLNKILDTETETYRNHATTPITLNKIDFKDGQFVAGKNAKPMNKIPANTVGNDNNEGGSYDLKAVVPQLMKINPLYTEENIRATAKQRKMTVDNVINQLFQKSRGQ